MVKKLLFLFSLSISISLSAQVETYDIDWGFGSNSNVMPATASNNADRTIEVGDTVRWTWINDGGSHNVFSQGGSQETFTSGSTTSAPNTYSYTFTQIGSNNYVCQPHSGNMFGTITVVAEGTLSTREFNDLAEFSIVPNPGQNWLNIKLPQLHSDLNIEVFDVLGKRVYGARLNKLETSIQVSNWKSGIYLVRVSNDLITHTKRFMKQ